MEYRVKKMFKNVDGSFRKPGDTIELDDARANKLRKYGFIGGIVESATIESPEKAAKKRAKKKKKDQDLVEEKQALKDEEQAPVEEYEVVVSEENEFLEKMNKKELLSLADEMGLNVKKLKRLNEAKIIYLLKEAKKEESSDENEGDDLNEKEGTEEEEKEKSED